MRYLRFKFDLNIKREKGSLSAVHGDFAARRGLP